MTFSLSKIRFRIHIILRLNERTKKHEKMAVRWGWGGVGGRVNPNIRGFVTTSLKLPVFFLSYTPILLKQEIFSRRGRDQHQWEVCSFNIYIIEVFSFNNNKKHCFRNTLALSIMCDWEGCATNTWISFLHFQSMCLSVTVGGIKKVLRRAFVSPRSFFLRFCVLFFCQYLQFKWLLTY